MNYRPRHAERRLTVLAEHFRSILVTGARQVGKSTLLAHVFPDLPIITFDPHQDLHGAREDPDLFLDNFPPPVILDEVQYVPELLPALKRRIDVSSSPGQYFLSGSHQLSLMKGVTESMAGRVAILQLDTLTPQEKAGRGARPSWLERYLSRPDDPSSWFEDVPSTPPPLYRTLWRGCLPGALDLPDEVIPDFFRSYHATYLERDVRSGGQIRELQEFDRLVALAGALSGQEVNPTQLGRDVGVTPITARRWLDVLAACHQWVEVPAFSGNTVKRVSGKRKGYVGDCGLACWLGRLSIPEALAGSPALGALFETMMVHAILAMGAALAMAPRAWHWRTTGGAEVDLVLEFDGRLHPIEMKCTSTVSGHDARGIRAFRDTYGSLVQTGLIINAGREVRRVADGVIAVPWFAT